MYAVESNKISFSWCCDSQKFQSQWLQTTLAEMNEKKKAMLSIIQQDEYSFAQKTELCDKKRLDLIKMVEEFHISYQSLAEKYDQLMSESSTQGFQSGSLSSSNSFKQIKNLHITSKGAIAITDHPKLEIYDSPPESVFEYPDTIVNFESLDKITDELLITEPNKWNPEFETGEDQKDGKCKLVPYTEGVDKGIVAYELDHNESNFVSQCMPPELSFRASKLMEDNLRLMSELINGNDEKRRTIKNLCFQLDRLMDENRVLQSCFKCTKVPMKQSRFQISRLKGLILGKFFRRGSS